LCIGLIGFYILSSVYFDEKPTIKTAVVISLALAAVVLQIFWK
jgi:multidrug transporter EmrE-like cation transporter